MDGHEVPGISMSLKFLGSIVATIKTARALLDLTSSPSQSGGKARMEKSRNECINGAIFGASIFFLQNFAPNKLYIPDFFLSFERCCWSYLFKASILLDYWDLFEKMGAMLSLPDPMKSSSCFRWKFLSHGNCCSRSRVGCPPARE